MLFVDSLLQPPPQGMATKKGGLYFVFVNSYHIIILNYLLFTYFIIIIIITFVFIRYKQYADLDFTVPENAICVRVVVFYRQPRTSVSLSCFVVPFDSSSSTSTSSPTPSPTSSPSSSPSPSSSSSSSSSSPFASFDSQPG